MLVRLCRTLDRKQYRPVFVEREFSCPILYPDYDKQLLCCCTSCKAQVAKAGGEWPLEVYGLPVTFNCRIDAIFADIEGYWFIVDHKSAAQLYKPDSLIPDLEDQLPSYLWCLRQNGFPVTGFILNQFRKAYPKQPKPLEHPQGGRTYSVNRLQLTDYHTARQTFFHRDNRGYKQGLYNDYLAWLSSSGPVFDRQFIRFKTPDQLDIIGHNVYLQARELINDGPSIYPNGSQMTCQQCSFQAPCLSKQGGHEYHSELQASFVRSEPYYIQRRRHI